ncbi:hypothetical protein QPK87_01190 [Kamptonema cortianum]|nr:hypothetical protein [Geitlerinema splendidum]MDK3155203.1 hypothetical protein [Kamptonema cortianum]
MKRGHRDRAEKKKTGEIPAVEIDPRDGTTTGEIDLRDDLTIAESGHQGASTIAAIDRRSEKGVTAVGHLVEATIEIRALAKAETIETEATVIGIEDRSEIDLPVRADPTAKSEKANDHDTTVMDRAGDRHLTEIEAAQIMGETEIVAGRRLIGIAARAVHLTETEMRIDVHSIATLIGSGHIQEEEGTKTEKGRDIETTATHVRHSAAMIDDQEIDLRIEAETDSEVIDRIVSHINRARTSLQDRRDPIGLTIGLAVHLTNLKSQGNLIPRNLGVIRVAKNLVEGVRHFPQKGRRAAVQNANREMHKVRRRTHA